MNTYTTLKTAIADWLDRDDLTSTIPSLIVLAEQKIYRELRVSAMEASLSSAISSGVVAVPSGYKELKFAYINGAPVQSLARKTPDWIYTNYPTRSADSKPVFIAREGSNFIFGPYPDSGYTVKGIYYKALDALSASNETNWFTANASALLLFAALSEAEAFLSNDPRVVFWRAKYEEEKKTVQDEDDREELSGSTLSVTAG